MSLTLGIDDYTSLPAVKEVLDISIRTHDDTLVRMIRTASRHIDKFCNRSFYYDAAAIETFRGYDNATVSLSRTPVISITEIFDIILDQEVDSDGYSLEDADTGIIYNTYTFAFSGFVNRGISQDRQYTTARKRYRITYEGGYNTPEQTTGPYGLPADVEQAAIILTTNLFRNRTRNPQIKREHVLEAAVWYQDQGFKSLIEELLDPYIYLPGS
jgi:hypothetical protein